MKVQNTIRRVIDKLLWRTHLGIVERFIPYPARAARITISFTLFPWWKPTWHKRELTESTKAEGEVIWWVRWLWIQIAYSRWA